MEQEKISFKSLVISINVEYSYTKKRRKHLSLKFTETLLTTMQAYKCRSTMKH